MEFSPENDIVKLCLQGMSMEDNGQPAKALSLFLQAWEEAGSDLEKFLAAYYVARRQQDSSARLSWHETTLHHALLADSDSTASALPSLYANIAECYGKLGDEENAKKYRELAATSASNPADKGPFYHGTKADLQVGDMLTPGRLSNYESGLQMNHIYFTAMVNGAGLAAALAKGDGAERVYIVEPTGSFENDPNVTDKKFPGNPTRSYRTTSPLKIVGEATEWVRQTPEQIQAWRERLDNNKGGIIN